MQEVDGAGLEEGLVDCPFCELPAVLEGEVDWVLVCRNGLQPGVLPAVQGD